MKLSQLSLADYNKIDNIPVINQDLTASGFTPVANTYYRHTGATTATFTQGVIYLYDTAYHKLGESGGGISDVKVSGVSVVTDGVANMQPANETKSGVVTTGEQTFSGTKTIIPQNTNQGQKILLYLKPNVPTKGYAYSAMQFGMESASGNSHKIQVGMSTLSTFSIKNDGYLSELLYKFSNYNNTSFEININTGTHSNAGRVFCGTSTSTDQFYLESNGYYNAVPMSDGTLMSTPTTWSSGTSGSVTLTESGTYQIKSNLGEAIVVYDGTRYVQSVIILADSSKLYYYHISAEGVITVSYAGKNDSTSGISTNYEIKYRKIGIA